MVQLKKRILAAAVGIALAPAAFAACVPGPSCGSPSPSPGPDPAAGHLTARLRSSQSTNGSASWSVGTRNTASASGNVGQNISGNVGMNIAAGSGNVQGNNAAIATANNPLTPEIAARAVVHASQTANTMGDPDAFTSSIATQNNASATDNVLQNASGIVGLNIAAGSDSMQANNTAIASNLAMDPAGVAYAAASSAQQAGTHWSWDPAAVAFTGDASNNASLADYVLQYASGNIGANVTAGDQNMQTNDLAIAYNHGALHALASASSMQTASVQAAGVHATANSATLSDDVLQSSHGNIGVNVAAGVQNMQGNTLAVSAATPVYPDPPTPTAASSRAHVTNHQAGGMMSGGSATSGTVNNASITDNVLQNASGNIDANVAAGAQNMQSNAMALASNVASATHGAASSTIHDSQRSGPGASFSLIGYDHASVTDNVLQNASGNIGLNVASGIDNLQANDLALAYDSAGTVAKAVIDTDQGGQERWSVPPRFSLAGLWYNGAMVAGNVMQFVTGNVGLNVAAGDFNTQSNALAISTAAATESSTTHASALIADSQRSNGAWCWIPSIAGGFYTANDAGLSANVLQDASGNINANAAAGLQNTQDNNTAIALATGASLGGSAKAGVSGEQTSGPWSFAFDMGGNNNATVQNNVLQNATGKIGVNVASGMQNMQSNDLAYAFNRGGHNATALTEVSQQSLGAITASAPLSGYSDIAALPTNTASVSGNVLQNASGDVGLNVAAGAGNLQRNTLSIANVE